MGSDNAGDKADHILAALAATIDLIYQSPSEFDYEGGG
jgi:hypothetical protein